MAPEKELEVKVPPTLDTIRTAAESPHAGSDQPPTQSIVDDPTAADAPTLNVAITRVNGALGLNVLSCASEPYARVSAMVDRHRANGLRLGDRIIEVNGISCVKRSLLAVEILKRADEATVRVQRDSSPMKSKSPLPPPPPPSTEERHQSTSVTPTIAPDITLPKVKSVSGDRSVTVRRKSKKINRPECNIGRDIREVAPAPPSEQLPPCDTTRVNQMSHRVHQLLSRYAPTMPKRASRHSLTTTTISSSPAAASPSNSHQPDWKRCENHGSPIQGQLDDDDMRGVSVGDSIAI
jgi:hypothetical protein